MTSATHSTGPSYAYTYDPDGRLLTATGVQLARDATGRIVNSNGMTMPRDPEGRITSLAYPAGNVLYRYDVRNLLTEIEDWNGGVTTFTYDAARRPVSISRPNGVITTITYDANGRTTAINGLRPRVSANRPPMRRPSAAGVPTTREKMPIVVALNPRTSLR